MGELHTWRSAGLCGYQEKGEQGSNGKSASEG